ncbi:MAG: hypothetical protein IPL40_09410 [Proteobacteria bacterium]|nr:hypothetical protein [Pseudomonadota bacterium]
MDAKASSAGLGQPAPFVGAQTAVRSAAGAEASGAARAAKLDAAWRRLQAHHQQLERELQQAYRRLGLERESDWQRVRAASLHCPERVHELGRQLAAIDGGGRASWDELTRMEFTTLAGRMGPALLRG